MQTAWIRASQLNCQGYQLAAETFREHPIPRPPHGVRASAAACGSLSARSLCSPSSPRRPLRAQQSPLPQAAPLNLTAAWQPLGPSSIVSATYNNLTGRVAAIASDPNDPTGNTVYLGTTGGGVWKSTNAAGPLNAVTFAPLTDTLPVFSNNAGSSIGPFADHWRAGRPTGHQSRVDRGHRRPQRRH